MESGSTSFKFLQLSDVHLDSSQNHGGFRLSANQRAGRYNDLVKSFVSAVALAKEHHVDAVLIPGGLWDHRTVRTQTISMVLEVLAELRGVPVFIAPGATDPVVIDSFYNNSYLQACGLRNWPSNVRIFRSASMTTIRHPNREDVSISGFAHVRSGVSERLLSTKVNRDDDCPIRVLLFHGTLEAGIGLKASDSSPPSCTETTAPFSRSELENQGFSYAALGNCHDFFEVLDNTRRLIGAYTGCLMGRGLTELGPRGAVLGSISLDPYGAPMVRLEPVEVQPSRVNYVAVDVSGLDDGAVSDEIRYLIDEQGVRRDRDIVFLSLEGTQAPELEPDNVVAQLNDEVEILIAQNRSRSDYLAREFEADSFENRFIELMIQEKKKAESKQKQAHHADADEITGETVEDALYYGLDALTGNKVTVRNVD